MTRPTDETLMAYADDDLPPDERRLVSDYLATDDEARAMVERLQTAAGLTRQAFDAIDARPLPDGLAARILAAPVPDHLRGAAATVASERSGTVVTLPHRAPLTPRAWLDWRIAAALALMIGGSAGFLAGRDVGRSGLDVALGALPDGSALAQVLETRPSGSTVDRISVVASFRDRNARLCREFEWLAPADRHATAIAAAVACRDAGGRWTVEGAARLAVAEATTKDFRPSGVPERDALDSLLTLLGAQPVMSPAEETALIANGWK